MWAVLILMCLAAVAAVPRNPQRIVGGSETTINQYPSMAALLHSPNLNTYTQACGGSIINTRSILTAAHCTFGDNANNWRVRIGSTYASSGGVVHNSASLINHNGYDFWTTDNDIAILRTATVMAYNDLARPASIAGSNYNLADNQVVWATGWGWTYTNGSPSEQLRHVQIWTINHDTCRQRYGQVGVTVTDRMLCSGWLDVGGRDQCQLDSGGPLYHNNVVVGVCSWGFECGDPYYPGVNARVSSFTTWIQANA